MSDRMHYTPHGFVTEPGDKIGPNWGTKDDYEEVLAELDAKPESFVSTIVYALAWRLDNASGYIAGIYCDQWCGVRVEAASDADKSNVVSWIQCDEVEWGLAAAWKTMRDHFNKKEGGDVQEEEAVS